MKDKEKMRKKLQETKEKQQSTLIWNTECDS